MRGYCHYGILLFPKEESYTQRTDTYHANMKKALRNIINYFERQDIRLFAFTTDEVAILANPANLNWMQALPPEDTFFVKNNCDNMNMTFDNPEQYPELYDKAREKFPIARGLSLEQRFDIVLKRNNFITRELIKAAKLVVHFVTPNNAAYTVKPKEGDNKIFVEINNGKFVPKTWINGMELDPCSLLDIPYGNRPVHLWEAYTNATHGDL